MRAKFHFDDSIAGIGAVAALEERFAKFVGCRFAIAMPNCTSALHAALLACGVQREDEVLVASYSWGGCVAGALHIGAVPVFADIDDTLTLDMEDVREKISEKTKAVIAVHLFGHPCALNKLAALCRENELQLIEDCAQAFGAAINGHQVGSFGIGCFSMGSGKHLNAGEGGMITTSDEDILDRILFYTQHPLRQRKDMTRWCEPNEFALNYRVHPLAAAYALRRFDIVIGDMKCRRERFEELNHILSDYGGNVLSPVSVREGVEHAWFRFSPLRHPNATERDYEEAGKHLADCGFVLEPGYIHTPLHQQPSLFHYLSNRIAKRIKSTHLPKTEAACRNRIGVRLANSQRGIL
ncbi:MAG: aminotransferase class I/II-fold pyridoxal phosphate-dependent enzyme [Anaerolineae bacterium]|nr:aminotransferase class I/II-fold pyridoxal phosphate-dependent enzyme [Anaerolineae bacterium]